MRQRQQIILACAFIAALGAGTVGGVLFAFSSFVMAALARLPAADGVAAMNAINITVINPSFMGVFIGTAALSAVLACVALLSLRRPSSKLILAASLLYLVGCIGVTASTNIPLNDRLATLARGDAAAFWPQFLSTWSAWNSVRAAAAIASSALFIGSLVGRRA